MSSVERNFSPSHLKENKGYVTIAAISFTTGTVAVLGTIALGVIFALSPELLATAGGPYLFIIAGPPAVISLISFGTASVLALRGPKKVHIEDTRSSTSSSKGDDTVTRRVPPGRGVHSDGEYSPSPSSESEQEEDGIGDLQALVGGDDDLSNALNALDNTESNNKGSDKKTKWVTARPTKRNKPLVTPLKRRENESSSSSSSVEVNEKEESPEDSSDHTNRLSRESPAGILEEEEQEISNEFDKRTSDDDEGKIVTTEDTEKEIKDTETNGNPAPRDEILTIGEVEDSGPSQTYTIYMRQPRPPKNGMIWDIAGDKLFGDSSEDEEEEEPGPAFFKAPTVAATHTLQVGAVGLPPEANDLVVEEEHDGDDETINTPPPVVHKTSGAAVKELSRDVLPKPNELSSSGSEIDEVEVSEEEEKQVVVRKKEKKVFEVKVYGFRDIPEEIWAKIFEFLPVDSFFLARASCKRFHHITGLNNVRPTKSITPQGLKRLDAFMQKKIREGLKVGCNVATCVLTADHKLHGGRDRDLQTKLTKADALFTELADFAINALFKNPRFILNNILATFMWYQKTTSNTRKLIAAFHHRNAAKFDELSERLAKKGRRNDISDVQKVVREAKTRTTDDMQNMLKALKDPISKHFGMDDPAIEPYAQEMLTLCFAPRVADAKNKDVSKALTEIKKQVNTRTKNAKAFRDAVSKLLAVLFDRAWAMDKRKKSPRVKLERLYKKIYNESLVMSAIPYTVNARVEREVRSGLKLLTKAIGGLGEIYEPNKDAAFKAMDNVAREVEAADMKRKKSPHDKTLEEALYDLEWSETNGHDKKRGFSLVFAPKENLSEEWAARLTNLPTVKRNKSRAVKTFEKKHNGTISFVNTRPATSLLKLIKDYQDSKVVKWGGVTTVSKVILPLLKMIPQFKMLLELDGLDKRQMEQWSNLVFGLIDLFMEVLVQAFMKSGDVSFKAFRGVIDTLVLGDKTRKDVTPVLKLLYEVAAGEEPVSWIRLINTFMPLADTAIPEIKATYSKKK